MTDKIDDAEARVQSLINITQELTDIFKKENELLETRRPNEILPFQEEKAKLAAAYAQSIRNVASNRSSIGGTSEELMETLRDLTKNFEQSAQKQRALLDGAKTASEGVLRAVVEEASSQSASSYTNGQPTVSASPGPSLVLNERA